MPPDDTWDPEICNCGRRTVTASGDLRATCPECHALPDYCECEGPAGSGGAWAKRMQPGGIILDEPETPPAVWGDGESIVWAEGESLIIAGPDGVGKTTLAGNLIRARLGIGDGVVLSMAVTPGKKNVLLLSMDRPRQARRSLRRQFGSSDREILDEKLRIWQGPPPMDLARNPGALAELAAQADADTIVIDSLKDAALKLADDETGSGWNRARQFAIEAGAELIELHHPRKAQGDNKKPAKLEDLYGSRWITAGAGSVISLWGEAGDLVVEFTHLKSPASQAGPWKMAIDPASGMVHLDGPVIDLVDQIRFRGGNGMTAEVAATLLTGGDKPTRSQVEKARYKLNKKVSEGVLHRIDGVRGGSPAIWFLAAPDPAGNQDAGSSEQIRNQIRSNQKPPAARESETGGDCSPRFPDSHEPEGSEINGKELPW